MKYYLEVDTGGVECDSFPGRWANYGTVVAEGNSLSELLDNASVDIMDQDGGELNVVPADQVWMADMLIDAFRKKYGDDSL